MKEPRNINDWESLTDNQKKQALKEFPELKKKIQTAYRWINKIEDFENEIKELLNRPD